MTSKHSLLTFLLAGLICSVTWLSADEPVKPPKSEPGADVPTLLKRIDQLEQRVAELERKVDQLSGKNPVVIDPRNIITTPQPDSPFLKNLPPHEINGQRFYHVPLEGRERIQRPNAQKSNW